MKHFGNSLSYDEIIRDLKNNEPKITRYKGKQIVFNNVGNYINGKFIQSGTKSEERNFEIVLKSGKWLLSCESDWASYDTLELAKTAARRYFGNGIKWTSIKTP
jgi:hypothetical protein